MCPTKEATSKLTQTTLQAITVRTAGEDATPAPAQTLPSPESYTEGFNVFLLKETEPE